MLDSQLTGYATIIPHFSNFVNSSIRETNFPDTCPSGPSPWADGTTTRLARLRTVWTN
ncbi:hypothetical protein IJ765_03205 [Candidatus Saccharibacteria bacterium]|nr:hypothetical protein [Candidatus Saccharibacteria bacterium]